MRIKDFKRILEELPEESYIYFVTLGPDHNGQTYAFPAIFKDVFKDGDGYVIRTEEV